MQWANDRRRYGVVAQALHWLTAALVAYLFYLAWVMTDLPLGPEKIRLYNLHKSLGISILTVAILRLIWRNVSRPPPIPETTPALEVKAARVAHWALYVLIFLQVGVGVLHSWSANFPIVVFGVVTLPNPTGPNEALKQALSPVHAVLGWSFFVLVLGHAAAALRHHFWLKDAVLLRMLPGTGRAQERREI